MHVQFIFDFTLLQNVPNYDLLNIVICFNGTTTILNRLFLWTLMVLAH